MLPVRSLLGSTDHEQDMGRVAGRDRISLLVLKGVDTKHGLAVSKMTGERGVSRPWFILSPGSPKIAGSNTHCSCWPSHTVYL